MKKTNVIIGLVTAISLTASLAFATQIRPVSINNTTGEDSLQTILNANFDSSIDAISDQTSYAAWKPAEGDVDAYLVRLVSPSGNGTLGIYSLATGAEYNLLSTSATATHADFRINSSGSIRINDGSWIAGFGRNFGFFWKDNNLKSYTEDAKNGDTALALTYFVASDTNLTGILGSELGDGAKASGNNDWVLAFDNFKLGINDFDYNDAVFYIEDMNPVPEPGTILLLGGGLIGLGLYGRKRAKKNA